MPLRTRSSRSAKLWRKGKCERSLSALASFFGALRSFEALASSAAFLRASNSSRFSVSPLPRYLRIQHTHHTHTHTHSVNTRGRAGAGGEHTGFSAFDASQAAHQDTAGAPLDCRRRRAYPELDQLARKVLVLQIVDVHGRNLRIKILQDSAPNAQVHAHTYSQRERLVAGLGGATGWGKCERRREPTRTFTEPARTSHT